MTRIRVLDLIFTAHAASALDDRGILPEDLYAILDTRYVVTRNRRRRSASHVLIGYDLQGPCLAAPIAPTHDPGIWRVLTAWPCKPSEAAKLG